VRAQLEASASANSRNSSNNKVSPAPDSRPTSPGAVEVDAGQEVDPLQKAALREPRESSDVLPPLAAAKPTMTRSPSILRFQQATRKVIAKLHMAWELQRTYQRSETVGWCKYEPIETRVDLTAPGFSASSQQTTNRFRVSLSVSICDKLLSIFALNFNLRPYKTTNTSGQGAVQGDHSTRWVHRTPLLGRAPQVDPALTPG